MKSIGERFGSFQARRISTWEEIRALEREPGEKLMLVLHRRSAALSRIRRRAMLRFELPVAAVAVITLGTLAALNFAVFSLLGGDYFGWYLGGGFAVALVFAVVSLIIDLDRHRHLISPHPFLFLADIAVILAELRETIRLQALADPRPDFELDELGIQFLPLQARFRSPAFDRAVSLVFSVAITAAMLAWALVVAPLQFWVNAVCGAPSRAALASRDTLWRVEDGKTIRLVAGAKRTLRDRYSEAAEEGSATELGLTEKPVACTSAIAAVVLWAASQLT